VPAKLLSGVRPTLYLLRPRRADAVPCRSTVLARLIRPIPRLRLCTGTATHYEKSQPQQQDKKRADIPSFHIPIPLFLTIPVSLMHERTKTHSKYSAWRPCGQPYP